MIIGDIEIYKYIPKNKIEREKGILHSQKKYYDRKLKMVKIDDFFLIIL